MGKRLIIIIAVICFAAVAGMLAFMKWSADKARQYSRKQLEEFRTIDKELQQSRAKPDSVNSMYIDSIVNAGK